MFGSILTGTTSALTLSQVLICTGASILIGLMIAATYRMCVHTSKGFAATIAVLPAVVMLVIIMVNGNLGVGVAVAGSFSLVRFRSLPGRATDIAVIFLAMATGLATGMGYVTFAILMTAIVCVLALVYAKTPLLADDPYYRHLKITIPEDLDYTSVFEDVLKKYTKSSSLESVKTTNLGAMYLLSYNVQLKDEKQEKELVDALRVRNGNLTIVSSRKAAAAAEL